MNYKDKKYFLEDKWLIQKLNKLDFFILAQLKSCSSSEWIDIQKKLSKFDLKLKLISFKNLKNVPFFSGLESKVIDILLKGRFVLIYSEIKIKPSTNSINFIEAIEILRLFILYNDGRFMNVNSKNRIKETENFNLLEWSDVFNQFNGKNILDIFDSFKISYSELLEFQHKALLNALIYKSQNENKF
jgi:hypothetical protein